MKTESSIKISLILNMRNASPAPGLLFLWVGRNGMKWRRDLVQGPELKAEAPGPEPPSLSLSHCSAQKTAPCPPRG